jgi:hypothetical protein
MRHILILSVALVALSVNVVGQSEKPPTAEDLKDIAARGQALAEYDQAAWHAGDAVEALHPDKAVAQRYVARKTPSGWIVAWGHFDEAHAHFLITYEAKQKANPTEYAVIKHDPAIEDADFYFQAASALEVAEKDFYSSARPARPYNISVLPAQSGEWYVYAIPGQQDSAVLPYGGDVRYTITADGAKILNRRQMHETVQEAPMPPDGSRPFFGFHTHILSDVPEDSDIFYAITRKAQNGEWVATKKYIYEISSDFSLRYLGKTKDVAAFLNKNDCMSVSTHADLCAANSNVLKLKLISVLGRLTGLQPETWPLQTSASFGNAQCKNGEIWLTLTVRLQNIGDKDLMLSRAVAGNWIQARFANSPEDLLSEKYEKLVFASIDPKLNSSNDDSFAPLARGQAFEMSKDLPLLGLDPKGKNVAQLLVFTWFPGDEKPSRQLIDRFAKSGTLYTEPVLTDPIAFTLDSKLVEGCKK